MLTIIPLWFLVYFYAIKLKIVNHPAFYFNIFVALMVIYLSYSELLLISPDNWYIRLDEAVFLKESQKTFSEIISQHQRYLLYVLFSHFTIETAGEWALKIQSVPFAIISSLVIYDATRRKAALWLYPIVFSYIFFLSTLNMRDAILICATLFFALKLSRSDGKYFLPWIIIPPIFYFFIRPEMILINSVTTLWFVIYRLSKFRVITSYILPSLLVIVIFSSDTTNQSLYSFASHFYGDRIEVYLQESSKALETLPFLTENVTAMVRQLITPLPSSKIMQMTSGGSQNLYIYELLRIIMVSFFYFFLVYAFIKPKGLFYTIQTSHFAKIVFSLSLLYTLSYAIYSDGGGDSRNKVYPYLFFFLVFVTTCKIRLWGRYFDPFSKRHKKL